MLPAHGLVNGVGRRMLCRAEQGSNDREALRRDRKTALAATLREIGQPVGSVVLVLAFLDELRFH